MKNKGISLIVLVVTIIVIIILAGAVILSLTQNNPINEANEATFKTNVGAYNSEIMLYVSNQYGETLGNFDIKSLNAATVAEVKAIMPSLKQTDEGKFEIQKGELVYIKEKCSANEIKWLTEMGIKEKSNTPVIPVSTWDNPYIPSGFKKSTVSGETAVETGLVIIDEINGNEFVWIPVKDFSKFERVEYNKGTVTVAQCTEDKKQQELATIYTSVQKNGGFYIARYEAGLPETSAPATSDHKTPTDGSKLPVSKKGVSPWNYVKWGTAMDITNPGPGAVTLSRKMYENKSDVKSTLIYGVQWDATLEFIKTNSLHTTYPTDSTGKGNYTGSLKITGSDVAYSTNNIYDMAGNDCEWTMEACSVSSRVIRGGLYLYDGLNGPACYRNNFGPDYRGDDCGFRPVLYIK